MTGGPGGVIPFRDSSRLQNLESAVQVLQSRIDTLERREANQRHPQQIRLAKLTGGTHPSDYSQTFPITFIDIDFTKTAGDQTLTAATRSATNQAIAYNLTGAYMYADALCVVARFIALDGGVHWVIISTFSTLWRFTLNENMGATTSNQAAADLLSLGGTDTGDDVTVHDPLAAFSDLANTDAGFCVEQGGRYYVIQAPCP